MERSVLNRSRRQDLTGHQESVRPVEHSQSRNSRSHSVSVSLKVIDEPGADPSDATPACALPNTPLAAALPGINQCVHCGFCLQACPTYQTLEDENESPRGRIFLMRSLLEGTLSVHDDRVHAHIDRCLGCRACEPACPSGVPYGQLLEATRATLGATRRPAFIGRLILFVMAHPFLMKLFMLGSR